MEILNIIGLLLIAATNVYIGLQVKKQQVPVVNVAAPVVTVEAPEAVPLEPVLVETVTIDYEKLAQIIGEAVGSSIPPAVPAPVVLPPPTWQNPVINTITNEDGIKYTINTEINGYPVREFPGRMS